MKLISSPDLITSVDLINSPILNLDKLNWICLLGCTFRWQEIDSTLY